MTESLELSLAVAGLLIALISLFGVNLRDVASSYNDCGTELSEAVAELERAKFLFDWCIRKLPPSSLLPQGLEAFLSNCRNFHKDTEQILACFCRPYQAEPSSAICQRQLSDIESQSYFPIGSETILLKLKWSWRKSTATKKVRAFTHRVNSLPHYVPPEAAGYCYSMPQFLDMRWEEKCIWFIDPSGKPSLAHIGLCKTVVGVVSYLLANVFCDSANDEARKKMENGEFWLEVEDEIAFMSKWHIKGSPAVLADNWEGSIAPGRKFRLSISTGAKDEVEVLHQTWSLVKPYLPAILERVGWNESRD